jgi:hypothetical protein
LGKQTVLLPLFLGSFTMKRTLYALAAAAALTAFAAAPASAAAYTNGTFSYNVSNSTIANVLTSTGPYSTGGALNFAGSETGSFTGIAIPSLTLGSSALTFTTANAADFNFSNAAIGSFVGTTVTLIGTSTSGTGVNAQSSATYGVVGTFTIGTDFTNAGSTLTGSETWTLNQTGGATGAVSINGTFASPSTVTTVPEPITLALFGAGLAGMGMMRRKKKSA